MTGFMIARAGAQVKWAETREVRFNFGAGQPADWNRGLGACGQRSPCGDRSC